MATEVLNATAQQSNNFALNKARVNAILKNAYDHSNDGKRIKAKVVSVSKELPAVDFNGKPISNAEMKKIVNLNAFEIDRLKEFMPIAQEAEAMEEQGIDATAKWQEFLNKGRMNFTVLNFSSLYDKLSAGQEIEADVHLYTSAQGRTSLVIDAKSVTIKPVTPAIPTNFTL